MDEETRTFAVETSAQIEVLKSAVVLLVSQLLRPLDPDEREEVLSAFVQVASDIPAGSPMSTPEATQLFDAIVAAIPKHAVRFAEDVRSALE